MRNQLLNFRPRKRSIQVVDKVTAEIYDILVLQGKNMRFLPKPELKNEDQDLNNDLDDIPKIGKDEESLLWELPSLDSELKDKHVDIYLQTNLKAHDLQKRLFYINQESNSVFQEQGYNILYLALGFLKWKENSHISESRKAPLIMIPVELKRKKVKGSFTINWTGEDILTNISLQAKLLEQEIELPDFEMPENKNGLYDYFQKVKKAISIKNGWNVIDDIYLGFFSFTKFVMYNDLNLENWPEGISFEDNPIISSIFGSSNNSDLIKFYEDEVDTNLKLSELYHVVDADSSQIAVIEEVKMGKNLVVEGPPGTGKSQTIVNLIAELLATGKTVLFVSEKMAALEVVKSRLDRVGLGEFCLELHSRKANKKEVLKKLEKMLYTDNNRPISLEEEFNELEKIRSELNEYNEIIHKKFGRIGFSPFYLFGIKEESLIHFKKSGKEMSRAKFKNPEEISYEEWKDAISTLNSVGELLKSLKPISSHRWRHCSPDLILPMDEEEIKKLLESSINILNSINSNLDYLVEITGIVLPQTKDDFDVSLSTCELLKLSKPIERNVISNPKWNEKNHEINNLIRNIDDYNNYEQILLTKFQNDILNKNIQLILNEFKESSSKFLKSFRSGYKEAKSNILILYRADAPNNDRMLIEDLENLINCQNLQKEIKESEHIGKEIFGPYWKVEHNNGLELKKLSDWILSFRKLLSDEKITGKSLDIVSNGIVKEDVENTIQSILNEYNELMKIIKELGSYLNIDYNSLFKDQFNRIPFEKIKLQMETYLNEISKLQQWSQFILLHKEKPNDFIDPILKLIDKDKLDPEDIIPCFKGNFADALLKVIFLENPILSSFVGDKHENTIKKFVDLDEKLILLNRKRIASNLSQNRPMIHGDISRNSELGILLNEINRKRKHMPIRKLFSEASGIIQRIKPCFMMSPLSIAQFIDPKNFENYFDVVIFDEASQVKPEDALGALLRGKQVVIMGDTKQLPPTSFFDSMIDTNDEEEDYELSSLADIESLLHLCKRSFATKMLRWHYRSRHESLIAVSNQEFYNNNLLVYPSPCHNSDRLGLKFEYLPDTTYDRGKSSANREEAREVVKAAMEHYKKYGSRKSLGIGTFNVKQQQAILEEVELQLRLNPGMEEYFSGSHDESFFIKNLETIQGDERDVIFVSVGYGFDKDHKLSLNFGPLNRDGGERRLNVLITRAREKCVVFSNFKSSDIKIDPTAPFGLQALKTFLEYAETKQLTNIRAHGEDTDSPFEDSVYEFLRDYGYEVHKQVGCAGFRIDLAIVDPKSPGRYLLGVECDGAMYHSSPVARDRDRLRQQVLEGLGWNIYRIWSTEWYRNRSESQRRMLDALKTAEASPKIKKREKKIILEKNDTSKPKKIENVDKKKNQFSQTNLEEKVSDYEICQSVGHFASNSLDKTPVTHIADAVAQIVKIEGPIHLEELARRVRTVWGLKRTTAKIRNITYSAVNVAQTQKESIFSKNSFVYYKDSPIRVRRRCGDPPAKIDYICDEEIEEAIKMVIEHQFATAPEELVKQVGNLFGIRAIRRATADRINNVIENLIQNGELKKIPNGMINFSKK